MAHEMRTIEYAQKMRDIVRDIIYKELEQKRPTESFATVTSIGTTTAQVQFPGDTASVSVQMHTIRPAATGAVVRIEGFGTRRFITEVVNGSSLVRASTFTATALSTTASAANVFVDAATGVFSRVTSSLRYKRDVQAISVPLQKFMQLRSITYKPIHATDNQSYLGMIAEEIAALDDPVLNQLVLFDPDGNPDAIHYDRLAVVMLPILQQLITRVAELESRQPDSDHA